MYKDVDIKNRIVNMHEVDTADDEVEIIKFLNKQMKVRFHDVYFSPSCRYTFTGKPADQAPNSITVSGYTTKGNGQAVLIEQ